VRPSVGRRARSCKAVTIAQSELAGCLRSWRERLAPAEAGLPAGRGRRTPGLRREEVAGLAGVSLDYLARLEQGRAQSPSASVLASLARTLRLTDDERAHLFRLAGHAEPGPGTIKRHITPSLQRLLDRLADVPVMVVDAAGEIVAANPLANALMGDLSGASRRERTIPWRHFSGIPSRLERTPEEEAEAEQAMAADLHDALGRFPDDQYLNQLIRDLRELSPRFAQLWEQRPIAHTPSRQKSFTHPEIGTLTLDCDALAVQGSDLSVIVYTAPAGSPDAEALALLGAIGLQSF
jgi:transcriptional regulator with XRE-family HTH domain